MAAPFRFTDRLKSFKFALTGIGTLLRRQHNAWIHAVATLAVVVAGRFFHISSSQWCLLVLAMVAVWAAEALNTAIEHLADAVCSRYHPLIRDAKDVAAGAVLIAAIGSVVIALLIFGPHLAHLLR